MTFSQIYAAWTYLTKQRGNKNFSQESNIKYIEINQRRGMKKFFNLVKKEKYYRENKYTLVYLTKLVQNLNLSRVEIYDIISSIIEAEHRVRNNKLPVSKKTRLSIRILLTFCSKNKGSRKFIDKMCKFVHGIGKENPVLRSDYNFCIICNILSASGMNEKDILKSITPFLKAELLKEKTLAKANYIHKNSTSRSSQAEIAVIERGMSEEEIKNLSFGNLTLELSMLP